MSTKRQLGVTNLAQDPIKKRALLSPALLSPALFSPALISHELMLITEALGEVSLGGANVVHLIWQYQEHNFLILAKYPRKSPLWLSQWFSNRDHFHCLMKTEGLEMLEHGVSYRHIIDCDILEIFKNQCQVQDLQTSFKIRMWQFQCKLKHPEFRGVPGYQCLNCAKNDPVTSSLRRQTNKAQWLSFVEKYLDLILEYFKQLTPDVQNALASRLGENWLEGRKDSVK